jgi:ribose transport system permease protein
VSAGAVFRRSATVRWLRSAGTLVGFAALLVLFTALRPDVFLTPSNLRNVLEQVAVLAVVAAAQTVVMVVGDFDLSVGAHASLAGVLAATLLAQGVPLWVALAAVPLAGAVVGLVNGVLVAWFGLSAFVATLATMTSLGGLSLLVTSGATLFDLPGSFLSLGQGEVAGVPVPVLVAIAVGGLVWLLLTQTTYGRRLHAVGGNAEVAAYSGIDPRRVRLVAFVLSALGAALAGVLLASRLASAHPTAGDAMMLTSIAAVFIGMTVRRDNTPNIPGTLLGVVLLGVLANGLNIIGVSSYLQQVLTGLIIVTAVGLPKLVGGRS